MNDDKETVLEIYLNHLTHNFQYLRSKLKPGVQFMAVVKAAGYGSDALVIAKHLQKIGADAFAVAYTSEGVALRKGGINFPILVLHPQPVNFESLIKHALEPNLYSVRVLKNFIETIEKNNNEDYPVQLKFNTGLNRIGFSASEIPVILDILHKTKGIKIKAILSHLAASEDHNKKEFTRNQIADFKKIANKLIEGLAYAPLLHQSNTSGILNYPEAHFDMVRSGIGLYGFGNEAKYDQQLKPISSLKSVISQIHYLQPGESLGYNLAFTAETITKTATIPIGHADGIGRQYGNKEGFVYINNKKALITGNVCMDMIMVDVTEIPCKEGDEVTLFDSEHTAANLAEQAGTISYEVLTSIAPRIRRKIFE